MNPVTFRPLIASNLKGTYIGKGKILGKGVFANCDFRKGEIVIKYDLKQLTHKEHHKLSRIEKNFVHFHKGKLFLYSIPERYVNHSNNPNTFQDLNKKCDIALRKIKKGEEITTDASKDDVL